ncbi:hypothetical protein H6G89_00635 [Oscillatoria sp. FACHB-1407]|uniref:hypothetical protein n=1 Tax=Oscillatoria sp. FACHB-1407 TaxID=2692847 RepID=UPI001689E975|nr:hypothetical protein [Oscillatoria sp. FACHB-1407]MBD2459537.1 hypothetical protein [Oscillatoria sp. FACHB-1407]
MISIVDELGVIGQGSIVNRQGSIVNCQGSIVNCQGSIVNRQGSIVNRQGSIVNRHLKSQLWEQNLPTRVTENQMRLVRPGGLRSDRREFNSPATAQNTKSFRSFVSQSTPLLLHSSTHSQDG